MKLVSLLYKEEDDLIDDEDWSGWIGLQKTAATFNKFEWVSGYLFGSWYNRMKSGEPNNDSGGSGDCIEKYKHSGWNDSKCTSASTYIC